MIRKNRDGEINCKGTIDHIQTTLKRYKEHKQFIQKDKEIIFPYKIVEEKWKSEGKILSKEDIVEAYLSHNLNAKPWISFT